MKRVVPVKRVDLAKRVDFENCDYMYWAYPFNRVEKAH